jgi:hypothetical protein
MKEKRFNFMGNCFPGLGLGLVVSYEDGYVYIMGAILCYQFYVDVKVKR